MGGAGSTHGVGDKHVHSVSDLGVDCEVRCKDVN